MMFKRGELTTQQIVLIVILIASFVIIIFFLVKLNLGSKSDAAICQESVALRGNSALPTEATPLKCKTSYVCISEDGTCERMTKPLIIEVEDKEEVYHALAEEMRECWWMFGEGKVQYVGSDWTLDNLYCSVCAQVGFDDSVEGIFPSGEIDEREFYSTYLSTHTIPSDDEVTYLEYLFEVKSFEGLQQALGDNKVAFRAFDLDKPHYVMTGITADLNSLGYIAIGAAAIGAGTLYVVTAPASIPATVGIVAIGAAGGAVLGGVTSYFAGITLPGASGNDFLRPIILEANSEEFSAFNCEAVRTVA